MFTAEDLEEMLSAFPGAASACKRHPVLRRFADEVGAAGVVSQDARHGAELWLTDRMLAARRADRAYWLDIIGELRVLHNTGKLMPVGQLVSPLSR